MKSAFSWLAGELTAAETVWHAISDGLREVAGLLERARTQSAEVSDAELAGELGQAEARLGELREQLNTDPLALWRDGRTDTARLGRLRDQAAAVAARAAAQASSRSEADQRIAGVAATVAEARQALQDATAARERAAVRVLVGRNDPLPDVGALDSRLADLELLRRGARWTRLTSELDLLESQASAALRQCKHAEQAAAGLLSRRDELRGLLDAYRAKAGRTGGAEDAGLDASYRQAHDLLWTAPCDLAAASAAVTGYQQAVLGLPRRERA